MIKEQIKKEIPFGRPWLDAADKQAVLDVLNGHILTHGPKCKEFEASFEKFIKGGHALTTSSCMASLHLASLHFKFKKNDEVIVPAQTHVATVHAIELTGATPVFVDCELQTGNIDIFGLEEKITSKTKAISVVHFAGIPVAMDRISAIAAKHNLQVIEDCALAVGARYKGIHVGLWGDVGCFSFYPVKHMTTAEGGMLVSKFQHVAAEIANFRAFSVDRTFDERLIPGMYDVTNVGLNYRMSELQAALGCTQLDKIEKNLAIRTKNFNLLKSLLRKIDDTEILDGTHEDMQNSHYCLIFLLKNKLQKKRNELLLYLKRHQIGCSVYYPQPVPKMQYYQKKYKNKADAFPNATKISDSSIALPVGPHLSESEMEIIFYAVQKGLAL